MNTTTIGLIMLLAATLVSVPVSAEAAVEAPLDLTVRTDVGLGCSGPVADCIVDIILDACRRISSAC